MQRNYSDKRERFNSIKRKILLTSGTKLNHPMKNKERDLRQKPNAKKSRADNQTKRRNLNSTTHDRSKTDVRDSRERSNAGHQKSRSNYPTHSHRVDKQVSQTRGRPKIREADTRGHLSRSGRRPSQPNANKSTSSSKPGQRKRKYSDNTPENAQRSRSNKNNKGGRTSRQNETNNKSKRSRTNEAPKNCGKQNSRKRGPSPSTRTQQPNKKPKVNPFIYHNDRLTRELSKDPSEIIMDLLDDYKAFCDFLIGEHLSAKSIEEVLEILSKLYDTPHTQNFSKIFAAFKNAKFLQHLHRFILRLQYSEDNLEKKWIHLKHIVRFFNELLTRFPEICEDLPLDVLFTHADTPSLGQSQNSSNENVSQDGNDNDENTNNRTNEDQQKNIKDGILQLKTLRDEILRRKHRPTNTTLAKNPPPDDYRSIPIFPRREDIFPENPPFLRKNIIRGRYTNVTHYLDVQFRLLREDYIAPIRNGVLEAIGQEERSQSIHVYRNVKILGRSLDQKSGGLLHRIQFDVSRMRRVNWEHSKRFKYGSLYCLIVNKQSPMYFVTITERLVEDLKNGCVNVKFFDDKHAESIDFQQEFFMVESPAYFESYRHVLQGLQNFNKDNLPFPRYLVECNADVKPPVYLLETNSPKPGVDEAVVLDISEKDSKNKIYDLKAALSSETGRAVSVLDPSAWPSLSRVDFNDSQYKAIKAALTQEFVVIQGPPGTGKTFIGLRIAKALLNNKSIWEHRTPPTENEVINRTSGRKHSPILVVCYTNHALDQFLEGILQITESVTRVGGRGKSECLERFNLNARKKLSKESFPLRNLKRELSSIQAKIEEEKELIEAADKELCPDELEKVLTEEEKEQLQHWEGVAYQMRVHRIEAWHKMQDEAEDSDNENLHERSSSACEMDELSCNKLSPERSKNTFDSSTNLSPPSTKQMNSRNSTIEGQGCGDKTNEKANKISKGDELEEGELPDSDEEGELPESNKEVPFQSNETRMNCIKNNGDNAEMNENHDNLRVTDRSKDLKQHAQERTDYLIRDYPTTQNLTDDIEKNSMQDTLNMPTEMLNKETLHLNKCSSLSIRKPTETTSQSCRSLEHFNNTTMSPDGKSDSGKQNDKEASKLRDVAMDIDIGKTLNRETEKQNNLKSSEQFSSEANYPSKGTTSSGDGLVVKDDDDLNEREEVEESSDKLNYKTSEDIEAGEILDTDDDMSDNDVSSIECDKVRCIDLTTIIAGRTDSFEREKENTEESAKQKSAVGKEKILSDPLNENNEKAYEVDFKKLSEDQRSNLYQEWVGRYFKHHREKIDRLRQDHDETLKRISEIRNIQIEGILKDVDVIGMTTTGAAKHRSILQEIKPRIVIVEEAAEVLEGHVITALSSGTDHLILIGDHKQLKPNPEVYELARKYNLDVSLFERMINNHLTCHSLNTQHRMRPEIADIMRIIYPNLVDDASVKKYDNITGIQHNVYFIDHEQPESDNEDLKSKSNQHEVDFVAALCRYLMLQGYQGNSITVLTMYTGQLLKLQRCMPKDFFKGIRICSVDNYQGEESDIIILSLVRSNTDGNIGFLSISNRVCVALSRAKKAMYCIGNISMMARKNTLWKKIKNHLDEKSLIGVSLPLCCKNHPEKKIEASSAEDFKMAPDGGCKSLCGFRLNCGHPCPLFCHPLDPKHEEYRCKEKCLEELCDLKHRCKKQCHYGQECEPCAEKVSFTFSPCKHEVKIKCCDREKNNCPNPCAKKLPCKHGCAGKCGEECDSVPCKEEIFRTLECGHNVTMLCSKDVQYYQCTEPCEKLLDCGHQCRGTCSECHKGKFHVQCKEPCKRRLVCSHECEEPCTKNCPPCSHECENRCQHSRCHRRCGDLCTPCRQLCEWKCKHYKCTKRCGEMCDREKCNEPCRKKLECGHQCVGICGDFCPRLCRICDKDKLQTIFLGREEEPDALYIELVDCGHTFQVDDLDYWMERMEENKTAAIQPKVCPKCTTVIRETRRYGNIVKKTLAYIEKVKEKKQDEQRQLKWKQIELEQRVRELNRKDPKTFRSTILHRAKKLPLDADACNTFENQLEFLSCVGEVQERFFRGRENAEFKERSSKLLRKKGEITSLLIHRTLLTNQEVKDISENIAFYTLSCQFEYMLWKIEKQDKSSALTEEIKSSIEVAKEIMSREDNATDTVLEITNEERAVVESVIENVNREVGLSPLTPKERADIVKAVNLSKGHWFKCSNGHIYAIGECGGAMEKSKCPECKEEIGGTKHTLVEGNQLAPEMDGARHAAWSDGANLDNYDPEELRWLQR